MSAIATKPFGKAYKLGTPKAEELQRPWRLLHAHEAAHDIADRVARTARLAELQEARCALECFYRVSAADWRKELLARFDTLVP